MRAVAGLLSSTAAARMRCVGGAGAAVRRPTGSGTHDWSVKAVGDKKTGGPVGVGRVEFARLYSGGDGSCHLLSAEKVCCGCGRGPPLPIFDHVIIAVVVTVASPNLLTTLDDRVLENTESILE